MARCLVTGAGKRLGRSMALYLARRGFDVAVHYASSEKDARDVVDQIKAIGRNAVALKADLLDDKQTEMLLPKAAEFLGGSITCLVNNASIFEYDTIETATRESWDWHFQSNLRAPFILTQAMAVQGLRAQTDENGEPLPEGLIVNMIDQRVRKLTPEFTTYTMAKMALWALTQTSAQGLAPHIRVNAIGPGPTLQGANQTEEQFATQRQATVLGRGASAADINAALGYFLDSHSITGQLLCVDGGQHLAWETRDVLGVE